MSKNTAHKIEVSEDLIINNVRDIKLIFLDLLKNSDNLEISLAVVKDIDISGLQLLISLLGECKILGKDILFSGQFNDSFLENINRIAFAPAILNNGEDLQNFIKESV